MLCESCQAEAGHRAHACAFGSFSKPDDLTVVIGSASTKLEVHHSRCTPTGLCVGVVGCWLPLWLKPTSTRARARYSPSKHQPATFRSRTAAVAMPSMAPSRWTPTGRAARALLLGTTLGAASAGKRSNTQEAVLHQRAQYANITDDNNKGDYVIIPPYFDLVAELKTLHSQKLQYEKQSTP